MSDINEFNEVDLDWEGFLVFPAEGGVEVHPWSEMPEEQGQLPMLQEAVGGHIEMVRLPGLRGLHMYCNEEGKFHGLPLNRHATNLAANPSDFVVGHTIVLRDGRAGEEAPLNASDLAAIRNWLDL